MVDPTYYKGQKSFTEDLDKNDLDFMAFSLNHTWNWVHTKLEDSKNFGDLEKKYYEGVMKSAKELMKKIGAE